MCTVYIYYVYINAHIYSIYLENIYMDIHLYIYILIFYIIHKYIKYNKFFLNIYIYAFIYIYIYIRNMHNIHTCYVKKNILDVINHLTALI